MEWTTQRSAAISAVHKWLKNKKGPQIFRLFGFAGTGKSTIAKAIREGIDGGVTYCAFTGKAALVMKKKGCEGASTIHSAIYKVEEGGNGTPAFKLNRDSSVKYAKLVIIDECSMVGEELGGDLLSFGTKILVLGDPAQLPPIKGEGFFTAQDPDYMLTDIRRQEQDNPIIWLSMQIREHNDVGLGWYGDSRVMDRSEIETEQVMQADQLIVGLNRTRHGFNARMRQLLDFDSRWPMHNDRIICLRNNKEKMLLNGGMWEVKRPGTPSKDGIISMAALSIDDDTLTDPVELNVYRHFFEGSEKDLGWRQRRVTDEFDYAYAITGHKSQGSQWPRGIVFDESVAFRENAWRWQYTTLTRFEEAVSWVKYYR